MKLTEFVDKVCNASSMVGASEIWKWTAPDGTIYNWIEEEDAYKTLDELNEMIKAGRFEGD